MALKLSTKVREGPATKSTGLLTAPGRCIASHPPIRTEEASQMRGATLSTVPLTRFRPLWINVTWRASMENRQLKEKVSVCRDMGVEIRFYFDMSPQEIKLHEVKFAYVQ